jgi:translocation and assembly module TamB
MFRAAVEAPRIEVDLGHQHLTLVGLHQVLTGRSDERPDAGLLHLALDGVIDDLEQNVLPVWQPNAVRVAGAARVDRLAALSLDRLVVESERGGTRLELKKRLRRDTQPPTPASPDAGALWNAGGQRFLLEGRFEQDLARLDGSPKTFEGRGKLAVPLTVDSADHRLFRVRGRLELDDVHARLPAERLVVEGATGVVPLEEAITFDPAVGLTLVPSSERHVFARARYQDVQPFLAGDSLLTVRRLQLGDISLGPVVASLEVQRNRFSLNKLKAEYGPARLSGQLFVDYLPGGETVTFRGAITGLPREGASTPLDANAAVVFSLSRLEFDGRVQVVRTSREHLLDLLDVLDPHREVSSLNRLRSAMRFGYPRTVQLSFGAGLLSMDVDLGGLAGLFDLGTVRGVSLGPFFTRYLAPRVARRPTP